MAHYAELDDAGTVLRVIVVGNADCLDDTGQESEQVGAAYCTALLGGRWVQTSYNARIRGKYAAIGDYYDPVANVFTTPDPVEE